MAMGKQKDNSQQSLWVPTADLPKGCGHPFYQELNTILDQHDFDAFVESGCEKFYAGRTGRPSLPPTVYFRLLLIGYFEGIDSERGIAWRVADSLALRSFLGYALTDSTPDHSTISRNRRLIDLETHQSIFVWVLQVLAKSKLLSGKTIGVDASTLEANAALRSIVAATRTTPIRSSSRNSHRKAGSKHRHVMIWHESIKTVKTRVQMTTGRIRMILMPRSPR